MSQVVHRLYQARYPFLGVVVFNAFEILTGQLNVAHGGVVVNPLVRAAVIGGDFSLVLVARHLGLVLLGVGIALEELKQGGWWLLVVLAAAFGGAAGWNLLEYGLFSGRWALFIAYAGLAVAVVASVYDEVVVKRSASDPDGYGLQTQI